MSDARTPFRTGLLLVLSLGLAGPVMGGAGESVGAVTRIAVSSPGITAVPVTRWDPASPQQLVRIGGALYQEDAGFYYPVVHDRITARLADGVKGWDDLLARAATSSTGSLALLRDLVPERANRLGIVDLVTPPGADLAAWCELLFRTGLVRYAEVSTVGVYLLVPNDPQYSQQWALNNTGQTGGTPGADIEAQAAWNITTGNPSIIVGVLDSGTDVDHQDLIANVWHNPGEIAGNGVDDDGNGFIDDWQGWDFGNGNNDPHSSNYHGTHVTGIINASSNNSLGVAGLAGGFGSPGVRAMAVAVGESGPNGAILDDSIIYAADNGAQVITMSLTVGETTAINDALIYARDTKNVFIDCAAGNNGSSVGYPARRPEVVAVASTDHNDVKSSFSNPGPEVAVAAPGSNILSTQLANSYGTSSGTSFSAPYVAALAALVRGLNPGLSAPEVRQVLIDSADDVGPAGFDVGTGWGRINAHEALLLTASPDGRVQLDRGVYSCADLVTVTVSDFDLAGSGTIAVTVRSDSEPGGETASLAETGAGTGVFRGNLATTGGAPGANGALALGDGDVVTAEYVDANDGQGGSNVLKTDTAVADCRAPAISGVGASGVSDTTAVVSWTTDEASTSVVHYGPTPPPTAQGSAPGAVLAHSVPLTGLTPCTIYRFEVRSADGLGNLAVENDGGAYFLFETYGNFPGQGIVPCHLGQVALDRGDYGCASTVVASVTDVDLSTNPGAAESIQVLVTSTSEPEGEWITLTEIGLESNRFEGTIDLAPTAPAADAQLSSAPGDLITVTYRDADDGAGNGRVSVATSVVDCVGPAIQNVRVTAVTSTRAEVEWSTDEPATSRVDFGPSASLGVSVASPTLVTTHRLVLSPFDACGNVHFRVSGADVHGDLHVSDAGGVPYRFNMNRIGGLVFHDNFEVASGWTLGGEMQRSVPQGLGSGGGDPGAAYSGTTAIGTDLSGVGTFGGDYEATAKDWATSPVFNASGVPNLELIYRRKLGLAAGDLATVRVFAPALTVVWSSTTLVNDASWLELRHNISVPAGGQSAVRVGFQIESQDPSHSYGWNVDEVIVKNATQPDYLACGGCAGAPTFGGVTAAYDAVPCGASGVTLAWEPAPAWGTGTAGTYDVHRGTTSGFVPGPGNRIASGLTGTSWIDTGAPVATPVWYVVRARNNEPCAGGEGLADANLVRLAAVETVTQPAAADPLNSLRVSRVGGAHARLTWNAAPGAHHYVVRRSASFDFTGAVEIGAPTGTLYEDAGAAIDPDSFAYKVFSATACE